MVESNHSSIGQSVKRLEGREKVTGAAKYSAEYNVPDLLHGYILSSTITKGKILSIHADEALGLPGVVQLFTHENRPDLASLNVKYMDMDSPAGKPFKPLHSGDIIYNGQPIGLIVATSFELARYAASIIKVEYEEEEFETDLRAAQDQARYPKAGMANLFKQLPPKPKGDFEAAYDSATIKYEGNFFHAAEYHNPLELFATTTVYEGKGKLTIYDKTQGVNNSQVYVANVFGLHYKNVRVISPFVGGAFGSALRPQYQLFLSVMAALELKQNVRVVMDRSHMYSFGHRPATLQHVRFGANAAGQLTALGHAAIAETSRFEDYTESVVNWGNMLYPATNTLLDYKLVPLDLYTPLDMRAPGGSTGVHPVEVAMDELAHELQIDPIELRMINYSDRDDAQDKPFSSKELKQCYMQGAALFGWYKRNPKPRSNQQGNKLIGMGMATGIWEAMLLPARAEACIDQQGKLKVTSATSDIGTGTYTVMTQIAAHEMGLPVSDVVFGYGDSKMPLAPIQGGSYTVATIGSAVKAACAGLKKKMYRLARHHDDSPFGDSSFTDMKFENAMMISKKNGASISFTEIMAVHGNKPLKSRNTSLPKAGKLKKYSRAAHSAAFVEVEVDESLGVVKVTRAVTAVAAGKIINPRTAESQIKGGMIWGLSKALHEEAIFDHGYGRIMNPNLAEYHLPVHADIPAMEVVFVEEEDTIVNELGVKGVGEIGVVAMAPAIANAIFNATGKRINDFPITLDKLL